MGFGGYYVYPLDRPLVSTRQAWGVPSGVRASHGRSRSPRRQPHFPPIMAVGPSARFLAAGARPGPAGYRREGRGQFATGTANEATAYRPLRRLAAFRYPLQSARRGFNAPLDAAEREEALADVTRDVYAASTVGPMSAKIRTIKAFLPCWGLELTPYNPEVVFAFGAGLKWRKYRSAKSYIYLSRITAQRMGVHISAAANRAVTDVLRSVQRGLGPSKRCEGLIMENLPSLPIESTAWATGGPWRPTTSLILGSWWMLREIEFSTAELRSVTLNPVLRTVAPTLPASKCDSSALGVTITHGCCCQQDENGRTPSPLCPYHLMKRHFIAYRRKWPRRFQANGKPRRGVPLFPDPQGKVC